MFLKQSEHFSSAFRCRAQDSTLDVCSIFREKKRLVSSFERLVSSFEISITTGYQGLSGVTEGYQGLPRVNTG